MSVCRSGEVAQRGRDVASQIGFVLIDVRILSENVWPLLAGVEAHDVRRIEAIGSLELVHQSIANERLHVVRRVIEPAYVAGRLTGHNGLQVDGGVPRHYDIAFAHIVEDLTAAAQAQSL